MAKNDCNLLNVTVAERIIDYAISQHDKSGKIIATTRMYWEHKSIEHQQHQPREERERERKTQQKQIPCARQFQSVPHSDKKRKKNDTENECVS